MRNHLRIARRAAALLVALCCVLLGPAVGAQEINGAIVGTIKDANGASVGGATVTVTDANTKVDVRTFRRSPTSSSATT
ncbi:MAG TPA: hypothetical protein VF064_06955 [Pyrinomonadaceae bacterium]